MSHKKKECTTCIFFEEKKHHGMDGICHRYPQSMKVKDKSSWCGEYTRFLDERG